MNYFEADGMLRAYANRAMLLNWVLAITTLTAIGFAVFVRTRPPTIILVKPDGQSEALGSHRNDADQLAKVLAGQAGTSVAGPDGTASREMEADALVRRFLNQYLQYTPESAARNLAEALNLMTTNLRRVSMERLRTEDTLGKISQDRIVSDFSLKSMDRSKEGHWRYTVFGFKDIRHVADGKETTDRILGRYDLRLAEVERSVSNPSGFLVAEYGEWQVIGERENGTRQSELLKR